LIGTGDINSGSPSAQGFVCDIKLANPLSPKPTQVELQKEWLMLSKLFPQLKAQSEKNDQQFAAIIDVFLIFLLNKLLRLI
jgi:hypothetical protein